jgi:tetratricopeptide (TPR) repeat protein
MASIYNNLYLSCISNNDKEKAKIYLIKNIHYNTLLHGERSLEVANNLYIMSNLNLKLGMINEAITNMNEAVKVFDAMDEEMMKAKDDMLLIQVRFYYQFSTIYYIKGDYKNAKTYIDKAYAICGDEKNYTYETLEAFKKILIDVSSVQIKCEAKLKGVSSLMLKQQKEREEKEKNPVPGSVAVS